MGYINGLVSVIIPTYHRADLLSRAVESVLSQTYQNLECIVVNDNTPNDDYSLKLYSQIQKYQADDRFVFIEQEKHINGAEARNCGIRNAKGEFIAFLDDDDWWKKDKIEKQVKFISLQNDSCGAVSTLVEFYKDNKIIFKSKPYKDGDICKEILRREIDITTCSILIKHACLDETGYFDNKLRRHQEIQLFAYLSSEYEIKLFNEYLTCVSYDDSQNVPNSTELKKIKNDFFESVEPILNKLGKKDKKIIHALHMFELSYVCLKEKNYKNCFIYGLELFKSPVALGCALKRIIQRVKK